MTTTDPTQTALTALAAAIIARAETAKGEALIDLIAAQMDVNARRDHTGR